MTLCHIGTSWTGPHHTGRDWRAKALLALLVKLLLVKAASPRGEGSSTTTSEPGLCKKVGLGLSRTPQSSGSAKI